MDFCFTCQYCNQLFEISLSTFSPEIRDLIIKIKNSDNSSQISINDFLEVSQNKIDTKKSNNLAQSKTVPVMKGLDMSSIKVDGMSITEIISNIDLFIENKICSNCYTKFTNLNENEIKNIEDEITKVKKVNQVLEKEIKLNNNDINDKVMMSKLKGSKSQEEATERLNEDNKILIQQLNSNIEKLKKLNENESKLLGEINDLKIDTFLTSKEYEYEKTFQQKNQFEQITLLNTNVYDILFDIQINDKSGSINGCRMIFKHSSTFSEICSGWGHILLLTNIINLKVNKFLNITKDGYVIYNMGDYSYVFNLIKRKNFYFYIRNNNLNDDSKAKELNESMMEYLDILKDIDNKILKLNNNKTELSNFKIKPNSINDYSIQLNINILEDNNWALCMKSLLILLKYYLKVIIQKENEELKKILN